MKLKDLRISTQLQLGLGAILILVALSGAFAWHQAQSLWQETKGLYDHPYTVRMTIGEIKSDALAIHREMKDLFLAESEKEIQAIIKNIDLIEARATRQIDTLEERYLGPPSDIDALRAEFTRWRGIRSETIRLMMSGSVSEARNRVKSGGAGAEQAEILHAKIEKISGFAKKRADKFFTDAKQHKDVTMTELTIMLVVMLLALGGIGHYLYRLIREPLKVLNTAADQFREGNVEARSDYVSANELGVLSDSFNALAEFVQFELQSKDSAAQVTARMLNEERLHSFCQALLETLLQKTGSQLGAVYLLNDAKTLFEHFESIGLASDGRTSFSATEREGEFGVALATRQIQHISGIPEDTRFLFKTVGADFRPQEIITVPILSGDDVVAVLSLASVRRYSASSLRLVSDIWSVLTARLNGVLVLQKIRDFSQRLEHQNQELEAQKTELAIQGDELSEQNIELELQKRQLDEANRLKSTFLSNMSHELRTPLNSVIALASVLSRRLANAIPEEEYSYLEVIERNGKNLLELINDILDLSRIESGKEEILLSRFSVRELVNELVTMIAPQSRQKEVGLHNKIMEGLPPVRSDLTKCRHILQNLIANAVKFTDHGSVEIDAVVQGDAIQITVTDTGIGIANDKIPYIFDEFRQADESMTRNYGGTGLGLSIAKKYATLLQGSIALQSALGKGSAFTLTLPLTISNVGVLEAVNISKPALARDLAPSVSGQRRRILVVEDNAPAVVQLTDILEGQGYEVQVAGNGREAIEQINKALPDAMILDLMMPEVDGFGVLKSIRSIEKTAQIPVLILTAKHVTRDELSFLTSNHIHQLIQKGDINKAELLRAVSSMVMPKNIRKPRMGPAPVNKEMDGKPLVLVVEDNLDNLKTIRALLQDRYTVKEATNGQEGLERARIYHPDLILMDISMPVMDGFKALEEIRNDETIQHIPVLAVTASAMAGNREAILARGFDGYLSKPVDGELLEQTIRQMLHETE
jgi:signal transduction histidine kinase/DNA-binding response OmpR family regulator